MFPECENLKLDSRQALSILWRHFNLLDDLQETKGAQPSALKKRCYSEEYSEIPTDISDRIPPAHPFGKAAFGRYTQRRPKYTYRHLKHRNPSDSIDPIHLNTLSTEAAAAAATTTTTTATVSSKKSKDVFSESLHNMESKFEYLSDSGISHSRKEPSSWLTTPRKTTRHRLSRTNTRIEHGVDESNWPCFPTQTQNPVTSRLVSLGVHVTSLDSLSERRAKRLKECIIQLGEVLWLGIENQDKLNKTCVLCKQHIPENQEYTCLQHLCQNCHSSYLQKSRHLPLHITASFRTGEAIATSTSRIDTDYFESIYGSLPLHLVRFVLWHHIVVVSFLCIPHKYIETLANALWEVGAFFQQEWLITARLTQNKDLGSLVKLENLAPIHLRAIDIGAESLFMNEVCKCIVSLGAPQLSFHCASACTSTQVSNSLDCLSGFLWIQYVPTNILRNIKLWGSLDNHDEQFVKTRNGNSTFKRMETNDLSELGKTQLSDFAKWVVRFCSPAQSIRLMAMAIEDTLGFIKKHAIPKAQIPCFSRIPYLDISLEALHTVYTMLLSRICTAVFDYDIIIPDELIKSFITQEQLISHLVFSIEDRIAYGSDEDISTRYYTKLSSLLQLCLSYQATLGIVLLCIVSSSNGETQACHTESTIHMNFHNELAIHKGFIQTCAIRYQQIIKQIKNAISVFCFSSDGPKPLKCSTTFNKREAIHRYPHHERILYTLPDAFQQASLERKTQVGIINLLLISGAPPELFISASHILQNMGYKKVALTILETASSRLESIQAHSCICRERQIYWSAKLSVSTMNSGLLHLKNTELQNKLHAHITKLNHEIASDATTTKEKLDDTKGHTHKVATRQSGDHRASLTRKRKRTKHTAVSVQPNSPHKYTQPDELGLLLTQQRKIRRRRLHTHTRTFGESI